MKNLPLRGDGLRFLLFFFFLKSDRGDFLVTTWPLTTELWISRVFPAICLQHRTPPGSVPTAGTAWGVSPLRAPTCAPLRTATWRTRRPCGMPNCVGGCSWLPGTATIPSSRRSYDERSVRIKKEKKSE